MKGPTASGLSRKELDRLIRRLGGPGERTGGRGIPVRSRDAGPAPLSSAQERLWFLHRLDPSSPAYNLTAAIRFDRRIDGRALVQALADVLRRHRVLRTAVSRDDEGFDDGRVPVQRVLGLERVLRLPVCDLARLPPERSASEGRRLAVRVAETPFDLERGPLLRVVLVRRPLSAGDGGHREPVFDLLLSVHHLVADGWSIGVFTRELGLLYAARAAGREPGRAPALDEPPLQYGDFAAWERRRLASGELDKARSACRELLTGATPTEVPPDRPRPARESWAGACLPLALPAGTAEGVRAFAGAVDTTPFTVILAATLGLMERLTGQDDLVVGTVVAGRERPELERLIGFFANTVVVRADLAGVVTGRELVGRASRGLGQALRHGDLPFATALEEISQGSGARTGAPPFRTLISMEQRPGGALELEGRQGVARGEVEEVHSGSAKFDLSLLFRDDGRAIRGTLEYATDLFDRATMVRFRGRLVTLLEALVDAPDGPVADLPLLTAAERQQLLEWNGGAELDTVAAGTLHDRFRSWVRSTPDAVGLVSDDRAVTYGELGRRAARLARRLRRVGIGPDTLVGLCVERSVEMVVGILGILESGGAYVPLDPHAPADRLRFIARDAGAALVLVGEGLGEVRRVLDEGAERTVPIGGAFPVEEEAPPYSAAVDSGNRAYVIYTSGSTGRPKGTSVTHANVTRLFDSVQPRFDFGPGDAWTLFHSYAFDFSVWELWGALAHGGRLEVVPYWVGRAPESFRNLVWRRRVTVLSQTPSAFKQLVSADAAAEDDGSAALRWIVFGGEALEPATLRPWIERHGDRSPRLVNMYGITETTVHVTHRPITAADATGSAVAARVLGSPVGRPIPDLRVHLLDARLRRVPIGVPGELHVGGPGVARGYLGRPRLTAERFVPDPCADPLEGPGGGRGERLYRSGDLARRLPDGALDFLGRIDHQVKVRGFRIEPGEVEAALAGHPAVGQVAVVARERRDGDRDLVAYVVPRNGESPSWSDLRRHAAGFIPEYMIPTGWVELDALPRTANDKLDRRALPDPEPGAGTGGAEHVAPRNPLERAVAAVFEEVFRVDRVGARDDFFSLGGHSLLATQVVSRLGRRLGTEPPLRALFEHPVVEDLARVLEADGPAETEGHAAPPRSETSRPSRRGPRREPASFAQRRLWFLDRMQPGSPLYNVAGGFELRGILDPAALAGALGSVVARHESLRTTFVEADGEPYQEIAPPGPVPLPVVDVSALPAVVGRRVARELGSAQSVRPFDLERGPLLRVVLVRIGPFTHALSVVVHHIVSDAWSLGIFVREAGALYGAGGAPDAGAMLLPPVQYSDHVQERESRMRGTELERQLDFWRGELAGLPDLELPLDRSRPAIRAGRGETLRSALDPEIVAGLRQLARSEGLSLFMVLTGLFQILLWRCTGQEDFGVGTPVANRNRLDGERVVGLLVNTLVLRADLGGRPSVRELLGRIRRTAFDAFDHQDLPFERLVEELAPRRDPSRTPLFQAMLVLQNAPFDPPSLSGLEVEPLAVDTGTSKLDLLFELEDLAGGGLRLGAVYDRDLFDRGTVERLMARFAHLARAFPEGAERPIDRLPWLPPAERHQVLAEWSAPLQGHRTTDRTVGRAVRERATAQPDAVAVRDRGVAVTYGTLVERARATARALTARGVGPEVRVGVYLERSVPAVEAALGVLEAGGVYVPLDPSYPEERIGFMVADARPVAVLTRPGLAARLEAVVRSRGLDVAVLDHDPADAASGRPPSPGPAPPPEAAAYAIYTSGSTGRPKGVLVPHAAAARHFAGAAEAYGLRPGNNALLFASLSFDIALEQMFSTLVGGGTVAVWTEETFSVEDLHRAVVDLRIEVLNLPTAAWIEWVHGLGAGQVSPEGLSVITMIAGGETMPPETARTALASLGDEVGLANAYGPTETVVTASLAWVGAGEADGPRVPIGRGYGVESALVLDRDLRPVGVGVPGELAIGGPDLARGYAGRPASTATAFVPDPYAPSSAPGSRLYRTGDLVRWRPEGALELLGRIDRQVKVRGVRVELGEVEAALMALAGVAEGAVVATGGSGAVRLVAFVVPDRGGPAPEGLREALAETLPAALVPSAVRGIERLPRTPGGKTDRAALRVQAEEALQGLQDGSVPPRTPTERLVAGVFAAVLGVEAVGAHDSFFEIGGHSLLATRVVSRLRESVGTEVSLRSLFEWPSVAGLAAVVEEEAASSGADHGALDPPAPDPERTDEAPLSFAQQRLWFLHRYVGGEDGAGPVYTVPGAVWIDGDLDPLALVQSLEAIVRRHEVLRTTFHQGADGPVQRVEPPSPLPVAWIDLGALHEILPEAGVREVALRAARLEVAAPFDLERGPLLRVRLIRQTADRHLLVVTMHHIVSDGWSGGVLLRELRALYAHRVGAPGEWTLPPLPLQYGDYALWQRRQLAGPALDRLLEHWNGALEGVRPLGLPTDRPRRDASAAVAGRVRSEIPAAVVTGAEELAGRHRATPFMVFLAALQAVLARLAGDDDVAVGSPIANRNRRQIEPLIGFFVNTLVLRGDLSGDPTGDELVHRLRAVALDAYAHQDLPFERLVEELAPERTHGRTPLFQVMFALQNESRRLELPGVDLIPVELEAGVAKFDLTVVLHPAEAGGLATTLEYRADLFDRTTIDRIGERFRRVLEAWIDDPALRLSQVPILTDAERCQVMGRWQGGETREPTESSIAALARRRAAERPDAVALDFPGETVTYGALADRATRLAALLRRAGVRPGQAVGLCFERSPELVTAILAVVEAGAVYVPLDPAYPAERLGLVIEDAGVRVILGGIAAGGSLPEPLPDGVALLTDAGAPEPGPEAFPRVAPSQPVYVLYTSGSTGRPKGVVVPHRAVARLVLDTDYLQVRPDDGVAHLSNAAFDAATFELWGALLNGARLVGIDRDAALEPECLADELGRRGITVLFLTTALFDRIAARVPDAFAGLRAVLFGGEAVDPASVRAVLRAGGPGALLHVYGPTENTTFSTWHRVERVPDEATTVPIGGAIANSTVQVVDRSMRPVPPGVIGELVVGGVGLAQGYLARPALTAERFVPDDFGPSVGLAPAGARLYRTGDLVRRRRDGAVEFVGRIDDQVKIRGFRIEPGEVETVLVSLPGVAQGAVLVREDGEGERRLVAYAAPAEEAGGVTAEEIRSALRERLPAYMVPAAFVVLDRLPLNPNGKIDRRALPDPEPEDAATAYVAPRTPAERRVARAYAAVLGVERVGAEDSFFDLGGHSLKATRVVARLREEVGAEVPLRSLFEAPTVAELAAVLEAAGEATPSDEPPLVPVRPEERRRGLPLSHAQERLWILEQLEPGADAYSMPFAVRLRGSLDAPALATALRGVVERHDALRTAFRETGRGPIQIPRPVPLVHLPTVDLSALPPAAAGPELARVHGRLDALPFDLTAGRLFRCVLLRTGTGGTDHVLHAAVHHIAADGLSIEILLRETGTLYGARAGAAGGAAGRPELPELPIQYGDFAAWQRRMLRGAVRSSQLAYWQERLVGAPEGGTELPLDRPRPAVQTFRGGSRGAVLGPELANRLETLARRRGVSLFMILLAGLKVLLQRLAGEDDVVVGSPIAGRDRAEIEPLIGIFLNTLVLRTDLAGGPTFEELLGRVRETALGAYAHQDVPFESVLEHLQPVRDLSRTPLFQIFFNMFRSDLDGVGLPGLELEVITAPEPPSKFDLTLYVTTPADRIRFEAVYNADLFDGATVERILGQLRTVLEQAVDAPDAPLATFTVRTPEMERVLPDPAAPLDATWHGSIHDALARVGATAPERTAVVDPERLWTYGELDRAAEGLAARLLAAGVEPGDAVALLAHRSVALPAAVFGILRTGGVFVLLDPAYPAPRLAAMVEAARVRALVAMEQAGEPPAELAAALAGTGAERIDVTAAGDELLDGTTEPLPAVTVGPDDPACIAFTSGSTGRPKGIVGRHGSLTHFLPWQSRIFELDAEDRFSVLSGLAHDPLQRDLFTPVWLGAALVLPDPETMAEPGGLAAWMARERITVAHMTPAMLQLVAAVGAAGDGAGIDAGDSSPPALGDLRRVFLVGDVLTRGDVARIGELAPRVECINMYGSTETQRAVGHHRARATPLPGAGEVLPLGRGMEDVQLLVLGPGARPAAVGEVGEVAVRSPHLALGYLDDEELTARRFVANPFTDRPGDRFYRTGDLGRYLADGSVLFLGRADRQVKIRGFRIELGEVEAHLAALPGVREAAVLAHDAGARGPALVGYVAAGGGGPRPEGDALRRALAERMPGFMVPSEVVVLDRLPLTPNRKVDRAALRALEVRLERGSGGAAEPPRTPLEHSVADLFRHVLEVEAVGRSDDFFALGGHSILATRLAGRLRQTFGVPVPLRLVFQRPTVAGLAEGLSDAGVDGAASGAAPEPIPALPRPEAPAAATDLPLSPGQRRLWFLDRLQPGGTAYNMAGALALRGRLDAVVLAGALADVVNRHEVLRTVFDERDGRPVQVIRPEVRPSAVAPPVVDLSRLAPDVRSRARDRTAAAAVHRTFDLSGDLLVRALLVREGRRDHALSVVMHHIVSDGWSTGIFVRDLAAAYTARTDEGGPEAELPRLPIQYADYAAWLDGELTEDAVARDLAYWRDRLRDVPVLELPADRPRRTARSGRGGLVRSRVPAETSAAIDRLARETGTSRYMVLLAAYQVLLARHAGNRDLTVGSPVANRNRSEVEDLIGFFVNTVVLRGDLSGDPTFRRLLGRTRESALGAFAHQELPFERLVDELAPDRDLTHTPLFQAMFVLQNTPAPELDLPGLRLAPLALGRTTARWDLSLSAAFDSAGPDGAADGDGGEGLRLALEYDADLFDRTTARRILGHLEILLGAAIVRPERSIEELPLLTAAERQQVLEWNGAAADGEPDPVPLHKRFACHARTAPDAVAVAVGNRAVTYGELVARSRRLAHVLRRQGVGPETVVGLCAERSPAMVAGILGILEAGGAYLPLDPRVPRGRLELILDDAGISTVLVEEGLEDLLPDRPGVRPIPLGKASSAGPAASAAGSPDGPASRVAYVIYTSGSTGRPKGSLITHGNAARLFDATAARLDAGPDDVWTLFHSYAFDFSVWELWGALAHGGRLEIVPYEVSRSPEELLQLVHARRVTVLSQTPTAFEQLVAVDASGAPRPPSALRRVVFGGEALEPAALAPWIERYGDVAPELVNMYGITETTVHVTLRRMGVGDLESRLSGTGSPVGVPIPDLRVHLLDPGLRPVPLGVPGEIHVGGPGLARGYLGRAGLTAERFVPDPFAGSPVAGGERLYKAGDLARRLPSGELDFLGRIDHQVKIRGFRIELGEIESVLLGHPAVRHAAVLAGADRGGDAVLAAYVVPEPGEEAGFDLLRAHCAETLPDYMVPGAWTELEELPLTANGKLDRRALPEPGGIVASDVGESRPPRGAAERLVARVFEQILGVQGVGAGHGFFELGGHSLNATRLVSRLRSGLGREVPLRLIFEHPTVAGLARALGAGGDREEQGAAPPLRPRTLQGPPPLSHAQERLWFLHRLDPESVVYHLSTGLRMTGRLVPSALARAWDTLVRRHEPLRTTFGTVDGAPVQVVASRHHQELPVIDLRSLPPAWREEKARAVLTAERKRPFDLGAGPLLRTLLVRLAEDDHILVLVIHHVVADGWSVDLLVEEMVETYRAALRGGPPRLPALPIQYADYAVWERSWLQGPALEGLVEVWRRRLDGVRPLELPLDRPRPAERRGRGGGVRHTLAQGALEAVDALAGERGATRFMVLIAALQALLGRLAGTDDLTVGTPVANRTREELEPLIGLFVNTLVLRADLGGDPAFGEMVARTRAVATEAYDHQVLPFEKLVEELVPARDPSRTPLFQVMTTVRAGSRDPAGAAVPDLAMSQLRTGSTTAKFDLTVFFDVVDDHLAVTLEYDADLFDRETIERLARRLDLVICRGTADPAVRVSELPLLTEGERCQVLGPWRGRTTDYPRDRSVVELFFERAGERPDAVALDFGADRLTYGALAARARSLAGALERAGVRRGEPVGLCFERSPEMIVAMVAVATAGAVYVPLDPAHPSDRLAFMVEDTGLRTLLAGDGIEELLPRPLPVPVRVLSPEASVGEARPGPVGEEAPEPAEPICILYTSGSTGRPKGVVIPHRGVVRLVRDTDYFDPGPDDRVSHLSNSAFDAATFEIWSALLNGATLVGVDRETAIDPPRLARLVAERRVSILFLTTALFNRVAQDRPEAFAPVRAVLFGGEAADPASVRRALETAPPERLVNLYGPTENTTLSTWHEVTTVPAGAVTVPIGGAVANSTVDVVDHRLAPMPPGAVGELLVGGDGLARAYLGRPAKTAEQFVPDPFGREPGARVYRTGDLVKRLRDGTIEFVGRADDQVKIRGFRIEPGEVEVVLAGHPELARAAVVVREDSSGELALIAYGEPKDGPVEAADLHRYMAHRLPGYMVPSVFVVLDELPITANGKVDRRALPAPEPQALEAEPTAPRTEAEAVVARAFEEVLDLAGVGLHQSFFDLGGHSLRATVLASRLRDLLDREVPLRLIFERPTVAALAESLADGVRTPAAPRLKRRPSRGPRPLSFSQERLWILDRLEPGSTAYNMPTAVRLRGRLDVRALGSALDALVARHESLRTTFTAEGGQPMQRITEPSAQPLPAVDLSGLPSQERRAALDGLLAALAARTFDLARGPLLHTTLVLEEPESAVVHSTTHHIVSDGWSLGIFVRELSALYRATVEGKESPLEDLPVQYADYAEWQREWLSGETRERQLDHWRERLADLPSGLDLPLDRPRPAVRSFRGGRAAARLAPDLVAGLRELGAREDASLFMVLLAAFDLLLQRTGGEDDVVVGAPSAGRSRGEVEGLIGMFLNTLVLRTDLSGDPTFRELLDRVRTTALDAFAHQDVPFEMLIDELQPERDLSRTPFFQVFFNMLELPFESEAELPGLRLESVSTPGEPSKFDLTLYVGPDPEGGLGVTAVFNTDLFETSTVDRLLTQYEVLLRQAAAHPEAGIGSCSLMTPGQARVLPDPRARLDPAWRGPIHGALARAATDHPDRPALVAPEGVWTFGALERWAGRLGHRLEAVGVGRGSRVAIYGHRSAALAAAVLATLRTGAAFTILDPTYPVRRLQDVVGAAAPAAFLHLERAGVMPDGFRSFLSGLPGCTILEVSPAPPAPSGEASEEARIAPVREVGPDDPAYVAFTSGSTGRPKGIVGRHGSLTHFLPWQSERFGLGPDDRFAMLSGLAHDPLQRDLFTPLWLGAPLVIPDPRDMGTPDRLRRWMARERVTVAHLTPAMGKLLTDRVGATEKVAPAPTLRRAFLVGDVLTRRDVSRLQGLSPRLRVVNLYGSTETQRAVGFHEADAEDRGHEVLPLGRGMRDVQLLVLDRSDRLAAVGEVGEIVVRSPHLALWYLDDEELTAARFVPNPVTGEPGDRIYRTGDLGRYDARGEVHFLGRADRQIKIRGFRIEPGEIVSHLAGAPGVRDAAVLFRSDGTLGERLTAYVVADGEPPSAEALRSHLRARLPAYMVPATWVYLDELPMTPNRKLDRRALLRLDDRNREQCEGTRGPAGWIEREIAAIVRDVLGLDHVGADDNFFDLGGNSLLLIQVHARLEEVFRRELPMVELFNHSSVAALARFLETAGEAGEERLREERRDQSRDRARDQARADRLEAGKDRLRRRRRRA